MDRVGFIVGVTWLVGSTTIACSDKDDCNATHTCGDTGSSGNGAAGKSGGSGAEGGADSGGTNSGGSQGNSGTSGSGGEAGGPGSECSGDVADDAACWTTNELGVFVSSDTGDDTTGNGSKELPYASIGKAIENAAGKNVYVCLGAAEAYLEKIAIDASSDGTKIYGGFECAGWTHDAARYVNVDSPENIALRVKDLQQGLHIENVRFTAAAGSEANPSSYGAFVTDSSGVVLQRVELTAGDGLAGADGLPGMKGENGSVAGTAPTGTDACVDAAVAGTWGAQNSCGSQGGAGGLGQKNGAEGNNGSSGSPTDDVMGNITNRGLGQTAEVMDLNGKVGADGNSGEVGQAAATAGLFTGTGFNPAPGDAGTPGHPGQGGGGGGASIGASTCIGASGGAGGMGGCGGTAGQGGQGGGASVGLLVWSSEVTLDSCVITAGKGGDGGGGGKGGASGVGADGGAGGNPFDDGDVDVMRGGRGGAGGKGGVGGSGSGGTGGPSLAVAFFGAKPAYDPSTVLTPGNGGDAGVGATAGAKAPDGDPGASQAEFEIL